MANESEGTWAGALAGKFCAALSKLLVALGGDGYFIIKLLDDDEAYRQRVAQFMVSEAYTIRALTNPSVKLPAISPEPLPVPADGEEFTLTLDPAEADPMAMVRADGYDPEGWRFLGNPLSQPLTKTFVHLDLGYCRDLADAKAKAAKQGYTLADGRFRVAYRKQFPIPTRSIASIFAGSEWQHPHGDRRVPYLDEDGRTWYSGFDLSDRGFREFCRWVSYKIPATK